MHNCEELILVDATSFCYRAFYAIKGLATSYGQPTNAVYGFITMIKKVLERWKPEYLGVCFDVSRDTFRSKKFSEYKTNRSAMPQELGSQMSLIREVVRAYNFPLIEMAGFEADDVIATLAKNASRNGFKVVIVASDKDILQLVDENISVFNPYKDKGVIYNVDKVKEFFNLLPKQIPDFIALAGDAVDNIPGIKGIGEKTAISLLGRFGSVKQLMGDIGSIKEPRLRENIQEGADQIKLNMELARLDAEVKLDLTEKDLKFKEPDYDKLYELFKRLEFKKLLQDLPAGNDFADVQITKDKESLLKELKNKEQFCFVLGEDNETIYISTGNNKVWEVKDVDTDLAILFKDDKILKITHDVKSAYKFFLKNNLTLSDNLFCTMLASYLLNPAQTEYGLLYSASDCLGRRVNSLASAVASLPEIKNKLNTLLEKNALADMLFKVEIPLSKVLAAMEIEGFAIDVDFLNVLSEEFKIKLEKMTKEIFSLSGTEFNINSPKQLGVILFERLKLPVVKKTKTGPSTDEGVLRFLAGQHKLPELLLEYRQIAKLKSTYVDALPDLVDKKDSKVHCNLKQCGTETGRLSCENPNLQNIPIKTEMGKLIRKAFVSSKKDSILIASDYSQIELRILAHLSGDDNLINAFQENQDIHKFTAALVFGVSENDVDERMRDTAKRVNFGIVYGISAFGLAKDLSIAIPEAQNLIDTYFLRYPKVKDYIDSQIQFARDNGYVSTILHRRRYLPAINDTNVGQRQFAERQAMNTPVQGSAADLIKLAMINIFNEIKVKKFPLSMILQVHDELIFEVSLKLRDESVELIKRCMENVFTLKVPVKVDIKQGKNWLEMQSSD